jgi:sensor domain CHASE-containing protein
METDIRYIWIDEERRYAYIPTIIDVFIRVFLYSKRSWHMKQKDVQEGWKQVIKKHLEPTKSMVGNFILKSVATMVDSFLLKNSNLFGR